MRAAAASVLWVSLLVVCGLPRPANAEPPQLRWYDNLLAARKACTASKRTWLILLTTQHCPACMQLKGTTLKDQNVVAEIQRSFVPVALDVTRHPQVLRAVRVSLYPTTLIISSDSRIVDTIVGYVPPKQMQYRLHAASRVAVRPQPNARVE